MHPRLGKNMKWTERKVAARQILDYEEQLRALTASSGA